MFFTSRISINVSYFDYVLSPIKRLLHKPQTELMGAITPIAQGGFESSRFSRSLDPNAGKYLLAHPTNPLGIGEP